MPICQTCLSLGNEGLSILSCKRGDIAKGLTTAFTSPSLFSKCNTKYWLIPIDLTESQGEMAWLLQTDDKLWKLTIDYAAMGPDAAYSHAIVDLTWFPRPGPFEVHPWKAFLQQFSQVANRWNPEYPDITQTIIAKAAMYQNARLSTDFTNDVHTIGDAHAPHARYNQYPILTALRCLVKVSSLGTLCQNLPLRWTLDEEVVQEQYDVLSPGIEPGHPPGSQTLKPHIVVNSVSSNTETGGLPAIKDPEHQMVELLKLTIENTQLRLLRGDPRYWPESFFIICLLILIHSDIREVSSFTDTLLTAQNTLYDSIKSLCQLFLHCCGDLHPLAERQLDYEWLELTLGTDFGWALWGDYVEFSEIFTTNRKYIRWVA